MSKMPPLTRKGYHAIRARMHELYPAAFGPRGSAPVPLKVGIWRDLDAAREQHGIGYGRTSQFLAYWTGRVEYLRAVAAGGPRFGLDGAPEGEVSPAQAAHAAAQLAAREAPDQRAAA